MSDYDHAKTPPDTPPAVDPQVDPKSAAEMEADGEREGPVLKNDDQADASEDTVSKSETLLPPD